MHDFETRPPYKHTNSLRFREGVGSDLCTKRMKYAMKHPVFVLSKTHRISCFTEQQFLVQIIQVPSKSRLSLGPCRMHIRDHRFCLTSGTPPRLLAAWAQIDLR